MAFVQRVRGLEWREAGVIAREVRNQVFAGEDFREGLRAFLEKRAPRWPSLGDADA
jgi:enoyl-CoA hydratase/carnithine racemase